MPLRLLRLTTLSLAALLALAFVAACDDEPNVSELGDPNLETTEARALETARALWDARGSDDYDMRFSWLCFCPVELVAERTLEVRNNTITSGAIPGESGVLSQQRIPQLFDIIEEAIEEDAASIEISYHPTLGYPLDASIDYDLSMADEELGFTVHELTLVTGS